MSRRSRKSTVVLLVVIGLTVFLWGCGGGDEVDDATVSTNLVRTPTTAASSVQSEVDSILYEELAVTQDTPEEYVEAVGQARPVVVLFYVPGNVDDTKVLDSLTLMQSEFPDYTFLMYDFKDPSSYGDLAMLLQVNYPPETVLIDRNGIVRDIWNGYVDEGSLRQCLINLGQG
jgi:hypothetical protein